MDRGIIASPVVLTIDGSSFTVDRGISPEEVRYYALYWDKVVIPDSNIISMQVPDEDILLETGIISRPRAESKGSYMGIQIPDLMRTAQGKIAEQLMLDEPGIDWVIHQVGNAATISPEFQADSRIVRVELHKALPMPPADVPIAELVDFKARRHAELAELHQHLDDAYFEILNSPDRGLQQKAAISRLKRSIENLNTVARERWKITKKTDLYVDLNLDGGKVMAAAAAGAAFDFYSGTGMAIPIGIVSGLASCLKVGAKMSATFEPAQKNLKLGYLLLAQSERLLAKPGDPRKITAAASQGPIVQEMLSQENLARARRQLADFIRRSR